MERVIQPDPAKMDDLNQENWEASLNISAPVGMPSPENFGPHEALKQEILTPAEPISSSESLKRSDETPALGQITSIGQPAQEAVTRVNYNPAYIRTTGDHLDKATLGELEKVEERLDQTGDLNNFYEEVRGEGSMLEANLNNSFNRELYGGGSK